MLKQIHQALASLPLARKLALMAVLLVAPTLVVGALFYSSQDVQLQATRQQLEGLRYTRPFVALLTQMGLHRDAAAMALSGTGAGEGSVREAQAEVDRAVKALKQSESAAAAAARFQTQALTSEILEGWDTNLKPNWNSGNAISSLDMHALVMAQVGDVIRLVGRNAHGSEPGAAATPFDYSLLFALPASLESLGQLGAFGVAVSGQRALTPEQWDRLAGLTQDVRRTSESLRTAVIAAGKLPAGSFEPRLKTATDAAVTATESFLDATQEASAGRGAFRADPLAYHALATQSLNAIAGLETSLAASVEAGLDTRLSELASARNFELVAVALLLALALGLGYLIASTVSRQVQSMASVFNRISRGDLGARADVTARDELGSFAQALNMVLDNTIALGQSRQERDAIQSNIEKLLHEIEGVAQGDLTKEAAVSDGMTGSIAASFNLMLVELRGLIRRVQESTQTVDTAAESVQKTTGELVAGSVGQASQIVEATSAVNQMVASVQQVTGQAAKAAHIAQTALHNAQLGAESARLTIDGMGRVRQQVQDLGQPVRDLRESSVQIGEVAQLIADISKRTSILALNASIQAAVAGDSGQGFGVVAEQVEELASRSSEAVRRVASLNKSIQASTSNVMDALKEATQQATTGENLATEASRRLVEIEGVSQQLAGVVENILSACRQQGANSESIARSMGEISRVTGRTTSGAQEAASSIGDLTALVRELRGSVSRFRLPVAAK